MRLITLTKGLFTKVDDSDFEQLVGKSWVASWSGDKWYVKCHQPIAEGDRDLYMHRHVLGITDPRQHVDHKDGDTLNNQRSNLRPTTMSRNLANARRRSDNVSGFKGVCWLNREKRFRARIQDHGREIHVGVYLTAREAAIAYDLAAVQAYGEFAKTNAMLGLL